MPDVPRPTNLCHQILGDPKRHPKRTEISIMKREDLRASFMGIFYVVDFRTIDIGSSEENIEWEVCVLIHISHTQQETGFIFKPHRVQVSKNETKTDKMEMRFRSITKLS